MNGNDGGDDYGNDYYTVDRLRRVNAELVKILETVMDDWPFPLEWAAKARAAIAKAKAEK